MENKIAIFAGIVGAVAAALFDVVGVAFTMLLFFMLIDYITGLISAAVLRQLNSRIGFNGFIRKIYVLLLISTVYALEFIAMHYTDFDIFGGHIGDGAAFAYIAIEFISITENGVKMNAPMPPYIRNLLKIIKDKTGMTEEENNRGDGEQ